MTKTIFVAPQIGCRDSWKYNLRKKMWLNKEIKQKLKGPKNVDICLTLIFRCYGQSLFSRGETGHQALPPTNFEIFLIFSILILSLKLFGNSWANACTKFIIIEIKSRFTCGESILCQSIVLFHYIISASHSFTTYVSLYRSPFICVID